MNNNSKKAFSYQLEKQLKKYRSYAEMANAIGVPSSTLKSWILNNRSPKLDSLDFVANRIGCFSYELLRYDEILNRDVNDNNSREIFVRNINKIFIDNYCNKQLQKYKLLSNVISYDALISYLRSENYRKPTLEVLDRIADELNMQTFMLIMGDFSYEKTNFEH